MHLATYIRHKDDPVVWAEETFPLKLDNWAKEIFHSTSRYIILNISRQIGKTTNSALLATWRVLFYPGSLVLLVSPTDRQSGEILRKCLSFYEGVDADHKNLIEDSKHTISLANGSRIIALPGGNSEGLRGYSAPSMVILDEAAFVNEDLYVSLRPMMTTNTTSRMILLSTPNGQQGFFYDVWQNGGSEWHKMRVKASEIPRISKEQLEIERLNMSPVKYSQEYECSFAATSGAVFDSELFRSLADADVEVLLC